MGISFENGQEESLGVFGDSISSEFRPVLTIKGVYGVRSNTETFTATGGSVTSANGQFVISSGTSVGGYGTVWSRRPLVYSPGIGAEARITAAFTTGIASSLQIAGLFSAADGMVFGYNGATFGLMHRYGGEFEVRVLTVTAAATGAETATITLNGTAYTASVTAGTVQQNCHEIEQGLNAGAAGTLWHIQHIDDTVVFVYRGIGSKSGTYSASSTGTLAGSIVQDKAGADPTEDWTAQTSWNKDTATWLDPTKGNIYRVEFAFLGYGALRYYVMHPQQNKWILVHQITRANNSVVPNFTNPSMRVGAASASLGSSGTDLTVLVGSGMAGLQGRSPDGRHFGMSGSNASITTETQILSCEIRREFGGRSCNAVALPSVYVATDSTKGMIFKIYLNPTVSGITKHMYVDEDESICLYDEDGTTVSGGRFIGAYPVGPSGSRAIVFDEIGIVLTAGDELVVTGAVTSGAASGGYVTINCEEIV